MQSSVKKAPVRYTFQKVLLNNRGIVKDLIFLNANQAFIKMTGLKSELLPGKKATEVFPDIITAGSDWIDFCGNTAMTGITQKIIRYIDFLDDWYKITIFSPQEKYFITVFQEITSDEGEEEKWKGRQKLIEVNGGNDNIAGLLLAILFDKSPETEKHSEKVKNYCNKIAGELKFTMEEKNELSLFAMLHDIGKIGISSSILQKPEPLTVKEWKEIKRHPEIGYRIARHTTELMGIAGYILSHHERFDGRGYPRGLKGKNIPLMCRVLAVADAYDAMTGGRVYRKAISQKEALAELKRNAGTQFDPKIVNLFIKLMSDT